MVNFQLDESIQRDIYTVFQKNRDYVFDDNLN